MDKVELKDPRKMRTGECRVTRRGAKYCKTARGVRFVRKGR